MVLYVIDTLGVVLLLSKKNPASLLLHVIGMLGVRFTFTKKKMLAWPDMALARPEVFFQKRLLVALAQKEQISSSFYDSLF